jgi:hypothetical protein
VASFQHLHFGKESARIVCVRGKEAENPFGD